MNENFHIFLYLLSSVSQSMAALFAIGGIFAIYQLQRIDTLIDQICNSYRLFLENQPRARDIPTILNKDVKADLLHRYNENSKQAGLVDRFVQLVVLEKFLRRLKMWLWPPTILIASTFLISLWLLTKLPSIGLGNELYNHILWRVALTVCSVIGYMWFAIRGPHQIIFNNILVTKSGDKELTDLRELFLSRQKEEMLSEYRKTKEQCRKKLRKLTKNK